LRRKGERGPKKAVIAVAAVIMRSTWCMLTRDEPYKEPNPTVPDAVRTEREAKRLVSKLKKLGYEVEMAVAAK
jgi:hypothetical protein